MSLNINVGLTKKIGLPNFGSLAASCSVQLDAEQGLLDNDPAGFQRRVQEVFAACSQAVENELGCQAHSRSAAGNGNGRAGDHVPPHANGNGGVNGNGGANGSKRHHQNDQGASEKQLAYVLQLAKRINGLGIRRLEPLAQQMFGKPLTALSNLDASKLIDTLKPIKDGQLDLNAVLSGTTP